MFKLVALVVREVIGVTETETQIVVVGWGESEEAVYAAIHIVPLSFGG